MNLDLNPGGPVITCEIQTVTIFKMSQVGQFMTRTIISAQTGNAGGNKVKTIIIYCKASVEAVKIVIGLMHL